MARAREFYWGFRDSSAPRRRGCSRPGRKTGRRRRAAARVRGARAGRRPVSRRAQLHLGLDLRGLRDRARRPRRVDDYPRCLSHAQAGWRLPMHGGFETVTPIIDLPFVARQSRSDRTPAEIRQELDCPPRRGWRWCRSAATVDYLGFRAPRLPHELGYRDHVVSTDDRPAAARRAHRCRRPALCSRAAAPRSRQGRGRGGHQAGQGSFRTASRMARRCAIPDAATLRNTRP